MMLGLLYNPAQFARGTSRPMSRSCSQTRRPAAQFAFLAALCCAILVLLQPAAAFAQTSPPQKTTRPAAPPVKGPDQPAEAGRASYDQLRQRIDQLEEQVLDMQVVFGTLESLARSGVGNAPARAGATPVGLGGSEAARIDALETQIRALTAQLEQLSEQVRALESRRPGAGGAVAGPPLAQPRDVAPPAGAVGPVAAGFGATIIAPAGSEAGTASEETAGSRGAVEFASQGPEAANPKQAYETAYGYLLQQNYQAAEGAFEDFLRRFPNDPLAGNAQFWLGESLFVRGQYKAAASAFLKGYQTYGKSAKAPDSLLKLAMSLDRLGQKEAACSSFAELSAKFPNAPAHVKSRAQSERQRAGC
jgi:tol-pal system protein YbgF